MSASLAACGILLMLLAAGTAPCDDRGTPVPSDVFIEDTPYDHTGFPDQGYEPDQNMAGVSMWKSRDIWARQHQDGGTTHENVEYGQTNYVYVNLHNYGPNVFPAQPADGELRVYYGPAGTNPAWPGGWTLIDVVQISNLAAWDEPTVCIPWSTVPPCPSYHGCNYSLLAYWTSPYDPLAVPTGTSTEPNVRNNNNMAWKNVHVVDNRFDPGPSVYMEHAKYPLGFSTNLLVKSTTNRDGERFLDQGTLLIDLGPELFAAWDAERMTCGTESDDYEIVVDDEGRSLIQPINSSESLIPCLPLPEGEQTEIRLMIVGNPEGPPKTFNLDLVQLAGDLEVGGVSYEIHDGTPIPPEGME